MKSSNSFSRILSVVENIPEGRVTTYGAIAKHLGLDKSVRVVGWALNGAYGRDNLPCHRVVNRHGELSGARHFATPTLMRDLLESEGVKFDGNVVRMKECFWNPAEENNPGSSCELPGSSRT